MNTCLGEWSAYPLAANPSASVNSAFPDAIRYSTPAPASPPTTWARTYGSRSLRLKRPATTSPAETAGLRWHPEMWPIAYAIVSTVRPKASETPTRLIPMLKSVPCNLAPTTAARTALPHPPKTSQNVPMNSAAQRCLRFT